MKSYSWDNAQVVLVGNKSDLEQERVVTREQGEQLAGQLGLPFFETSARLGWNVPEVFDKLVDLICDAMSKSLDNDPTLPRATGPDDLLTDSPPQPEARGCKC